MPVYRSVRLDGEWWRVLVDTVEEQGANVLAVQLPPGTKGLPPHLISLLRSCTAAVLVYKEKEVGRAVNLRSSTPRLSTSFNPNSLSKMLEGMRMDR